MLDLDATAAGANFATTFTENGAAVAIANPIAGGVSITDVDSTAADMLEDLDESLNADGISLIFAEMKDPVREKVERYELTATIEPAQFYPTIEAAVTAYREETGVDWVQPGDSA